MRKYDDAKVAAALHAEALQTQKSVNDFYTRVTSEERVRVFDMGYEQALRDYNAGPYAPKVAE